MNKHWQAIYVNSRAEKKVGEDLYSKNIEAYVPLIKTMRQWSDRKKMVELPLLNGYVFVNIAEKDQEKVLHTRGVVSFVKSEGKTAVIRQVEIDRLKQLVELGYQMETGGITKSYKEGDKIKINSGPLKGIEGYISSRRGGQQVEVLLESIGQYIRVKLPQDILTEAK